MTEQRRRPVRSDAAARPAREGLGFRRREAGESAGRVRDEARRPGSAFRGRDENRRSGPAVAERGEARRTAPVEGRRDERRPAAQEARRPTEGARSSEARGTGGAFRQREAGQRSERSAEYRGERTGMNPSDRSAARSSAGQERGARPPRDDGRDRSGQQARSGKTDRYQGGNQDRARDGAKRESFAGQDRNSGRGQAHSAPYRGDDRRAEGRPGRDEGYRAERRESGRGDERRGDGGARPPRDHRPHEGGRPEGRREFQGSRDDRPSRHADTGRHDYTARGERGAEAGHGREAAGAKPDVPRRPWVHPLEVRTTQLAQLLEQIFTWEYPADAALSHWLRRHPQLGVRDRAQLAEALYDVLRNLRRYRQYAESGSGSTLRRLAQLGLAATMGRDALRPVLNESESEWLQRVDGIDLDSLPLAVRHSVPDWLGEALAELPDGEALMAALNQPAGLDLRVNPMKADRDEMLEALRKSMPQHDPQATRFSPWGIRVAGRPALQRSPQFEHGLLEVQDEGSQLLALLVGPKRGEMIIDFCAGAGGKTLLLGALMRSTGRLYAFDVSAARLTRAKPRLARSGLSNVATVVIENENDVRVKRLSGKAQRVLVDAPCSGMGTLRRNPDMKWRQSSQSVREMCELQARVLESAARCVAPGGRLVYATCSVLPQENEAQVESFLKKHPDFRLLDAGAILESRAPGLGLKDAYLRLRPDVHGTDGFFAAALERVAQDA